MTTSIETRSRQILALHRYLTTTDATHFALDKITPDDLTLARHIIEKTKKRDDNSSSPSITRNDDDHDEDTSWPESWTMNARSLASVLSWFRRKATDTLKALPPAANGSWEPLDLDLDLDEQPHATAVATKTAVPTSSSDSPPTQPPTTTTAVTMVAPGAPQEQAQPSRPPQRRRMSRVIVMAPSVTMGPAAAVQHEAHSANPSSFSFTAAEATHTTPSGRVGEQVHRIERRTAGPENTKKETPCTSDAASGAGAGSGARWRTTNANNGESRKLGAASPSSLLSMSNDTAGAANTSADANHHNRHRHHLRALASHPRADGVEVVAEAQAPSPPPARRGGWGRDRSASSGVSSNVTAIIAQTSTAAPVPTRPQQPQQQDDGLSPSDPTPDLYATFLYQRRVERLAARGRAKKMVEGAPEDMQSRVRCWLDGAEREADE